MAILILGHLALMPLFYKQVNFLFVVSMVFSHEAKIYLIASLDKTRLVEGIPQTNKVSPFTFRFLLPRTRDQMQYRRREIQINFKFITELASPPCTNKCIRVLGSTCTDRHVSCRKRHTDIIFMWSLLSCKVFHVRYDFRKL